MGRIQHGTGQVDQPLPVQELEHLLVEPTPDTGPGPDQEPAVHRRLRRPEARRQSPPGTAADQHVHDRGEDRLVIDVRHPAALRTHPRSRQQRLHQLPQPVRNNPAPPPTPHDRINGQQPCRTRS